MYFNVFFLPVGYLHFYKNISSDSYQLLSSNYTIFYIPFYNVLFCNCTLKLLIIYVKDI